VQEVPLAAEKSKLAKGYRQALMAEWSTVRNDPNYPEPLDAEIIPLCDALNAAGFVTESSCCGHGYRNPAVWFEHSTDERIESLARFVIRRESGDYKPHYSVFEKEILFEGYRWALHIHVSDVYGNTPEVESLKKSVQAITEVTRSIEDWFASERAAVTLVANPTDAPYRNEPSY
jgi:hypothetical protein